MVRVKKLHDELTDAGMAGPRKGFLPMEKDGTF